MRFDQRGVLNSVEFKILNLNSKYEWKQVNFQKIKHSIKQLNLEINLLNSIIIWYRALYA